MLVFSGSQNSVYLYLGNSKQQTASMKRFLSSFLLLLSLHTAYSQCLTAFRDTRETRQDFFYVFENESLTQQEYQMINTYKVGNKYIAYTDFTLSFKVYQNGQTIKLQDFAPVEYHVTDHLLVYRNPGDLMYAFDGKKVHALGRLHQEIKQYAYGDSVVAFNDFMNSFVLFFNGETRTYDNRNVMQFAGAENIVAFVAINYEYNIFYNGEILSLETGSAPRSFKIHNNVVAYVDFVGDFKVFQSGEVIRLQTLPPISYEVGENMVAYVTDIEKKFMVNYQGNDYELMPIPPKKYEIVDNMLVYFDQYDHLHVFSDGIEQRLAAYTPASYAIDRNAVVFTDLDRGLMGFINGTLQQISSEQVKNYSLNNTSVLFQRVESTMRVFCDGVVTQLY